MSKRLWRLLLILLVLTPLVGTAYGEDNLGQLLRNTKEGKSRHLNWIGRWHLKRIKKEDPIHVQKTLETFFAGLNTNCQYQVLFQFEKQIKQQDFKRNAHKNIRPFLYKARKINLIDDVTLGILLKSHKDIKNLRIKNKPQWYRKNYEGESEEELKQIMLQNQLALDKSACLAPLWRSTVGRFKELEIKNSDQSIRRLLAEMLRQKEITPKTYGLLDMARKRDLEERPLTLSAYVRKLSQLRNRFGQGQGTSDVVSKKSDEEKLSYRERLFQKYDFIQIQLLSELVEKMRVRLDAFEVAIEVRNEEGNVLEEIILEPLEQYRFAAKMVRKEMELLKTSTLMQGRSVSYMDLVTASFETGLVSPEELAEIAKIELIWNPEVSWKDKVLNFVKTYGGLTSVFLPPGYNLIPVLGILVLEAFTRDNNQNPERNHALF